MKKFINKIKGKQKQLTNSEVGETSKNRETENTNIFHETQQGNTQSWLDKNYPKSSTCTRTKLISTREWVYGYGGMWSYSHKTVKHEDYEKKRKEITSLDISRESLTGVLDLTGFTNLKELNCSYNPITRIILPIKNKIEKLICYNNELNELPINLNPKTLTVLMINKNNFQSDLTIFSEFTNLERLFIGENHFSGSLAPLANLSKLHVLCVKNTQIDFALLGYLPKSLGWLDCQGTKLATELEVYGQPQRKEDFLNYFPLLQKWRNNPQAQDIWKLKESLNNLNLALTEKSYKNNKTGEIKKENLQLDQITNDALVVVRRELENLLFALEQENNQQQAQIQIQAH